MIRVIDMTEATSNAEFTFAVWDTVHGLFMVGEDESLTWTLSEWAEEDPLPRVRDRVEGLLEPHRFPLTQTTIDALTPTILGTPEPSFGKLLIDRATYRKWFIKNHLQRYRQHFPEMMPHDGGRPVWAPGAWTNRPSAAEEEFETVDLDEDHLAILFSGDTFGLPESGGQNLVVKADFNAIERALHLAVEASGWCLHCFQDGVGGPGLGCNAICSGNCPLHEEDPCVRKPPHEGGHLCIRCVEDSNRGSVGSPGGE